MGEGIEFQGHTDASPTPSPRWILRFAPGHGTACTPPKPWGSSRWKDLSWDSPPSTPMLANIIYLPQMKQQAALGGAYSSAPPISLLSSINCSPEANNPFLMCGQKASNNPGLHHDAYVTPLASSPHRGASPSHTIPRRRVSTGL